LEGRSAPLPPIHISQAGGGGVLKKHGKQSQCIGDVRVEVGKITWRTVKGGKVKWNETGKNHI
jgi:hypothetical protein